MKRSLVISLVATVAITIIVFAATLGAGWAPKLGLDLAGGSEVVYKPAHAISSGEMDTTVNIIRNRVDGAGVSGATVDAQGGNVVVQFPGVKNPGALINAHRHHGPALLPAGAVRSARPTPARQGQGSAHRPPAVVRPVRHHGGQPGGEHEHRAARQQHPPQPGLRPRTRRPTTTTPTRSCCSRPIPRPEPSSTRASCSGKSQLPGSAVASASAVFDTTISAWAVSYTLKAVTPWDNVAQANFHQYVAIDLDGLVESAPLIQPNNATFTFVRRARARSAGTSPRRRPRTSPSSSTTARCR